MSISAGASRDGEGGGVSVTSGSSEALPSGDATLATAGKEHPAIAATYIQRLACSISLATPSNAIPFQRSTTAIAGLDGSTQGRTSSGAIVIKTGANYAEDEPSGAIIIETGEAHLGRGGAITIRSSDGAILDGGAVAISAGSTRGSRAAGGAVSIAAGSGLNADEGARLLGVYSSRPSASLTLFTLPSPTQVTEATADGLTCPRASPTAGPRSITAGRRP